MKRKKAIQAQTSIHEVKDLLSLTKEIDQNK